MPRAFFDYSSDAERRAIEAAIAHVQDMHQLALASEGGDVLTQCEDLALDKGRRLIRENLETAVNSRVALDEKKGGPPAAAARAPDRSA